MSERTLNAAPRASALRELLLALRLLKPRERRRAMWLGMLAVLAGLVETLALASAMPFVALVVDVDSALANPRMSAAHAFLGAPPPSTFVLLAGTASLGIITVAGVLSWWVRRHTNRFVAECQSRLAEDVMDALVHAPYAWFLGINAQLAAHVFQRDVLLWARDLVFKLLNMTRDVALIVMPLALVLAVTPFAGVLTLAGITLVVAFVIRYSRPRITRLTQLKQDADAQAFALSGQALSGIKDVVISGRQEEFVQSFARAYRNYAWAQAALQNQHQLPATAILLLGQIALLVVGMVLWSTGSDRGTLAAQMSLLLLVTSRIVPAANRLSSATTTFFSVLPAVRGIDGMLSGIRNAGDAGRAASAHTLVPRPWRRIAFQDASYAYPGTSRPALTGISVDLEAGRSYGIVGASGAGKSTFADLLMGFVAPSAGAVTIDDRPLSEVSLASWRSRIGYVPQNPFIADATLASNIAFGVRAKHVDRLRLGRAITLARLERLVAELPQGLDTNLGDRGIRLSGGQRQRVAIARALYDDCDLLVLDEATSALDSVVERDIAESVHALSGRVTLVIIAHRISTIAECNEILVFENGCLMARGPHAKLAAENRHYRMLVAGQTVVSGRACEPEELGRAAG